MLKKIWINLLTFLGVVIGGIAYILSMKPKKVSDEMGKTIISDISKLDAATKYRVMRSIDSKLK